MDRTGIHAENEMLERVLPLAVAQGTSDLFTPDRCTGCRISDCPEYYFLMKLAAEVLWAEQGT